MKRAIRISILMVGLVGTFVAAAVQQVPAAGRRSATSVPTQTTKAVKQPCHRSRTGQQIDRKVTKVTCRNCNSGPRK